MLLESIENKWKSASVQAKCDECGAEYRARISTALKQYEELGLHQCKKCSSRRAGKKTALKMSATYSEWYSGDGNPSKRLDVRKKISDSKKGVPLSIEHKQALCKPKSKTDKIKEAANRPQEVERRRQRALNNNPTKSKEVREKISRSVSELFRSGKFTRNLDTGWVKNSKTCNPIWCRSGLEKAFLEAASKIESIYMIESAESISISYEFDGITRQYLPDFKLTFKDDSVMIVEVKSTYFQSFEKSKFKAIALLNFCTKNKIEYAILNEKEFLSWLEQL